MSDLSEEELFYFRCAARLSPVVLCWCLSVWDSKESGLEKGRRDMDAFSSC